MIYMSLISRFKNINGKLTKYNKVVLIIYTCNDTDFGPEYTILFIIYDERIVMTINLSL